jgi:hypothetical protein
MFQKSKDPYLSLCLPSLWGANFRAYRGQVTQLQFCAF